MKRIIIDEETGEIIGELLKGDRIMRKNSIEHLNNKEKIEMEDFVKYNSGLTAKLNSYKLSSAEILIFLMLAENIKYKSQIAKHKNGKMITRDDLVDMLGFTYQTVKTSISKLIKCGLIVEAKTQFGRVFIINPYVVIKGNEVDKFSAELFKSPKI